MSIPDTAATISQNCLFLRTRLLDRTLNAVYDQVLRPWDIKSEQMVVLVVLKRAGKLPPGPLSKILRLEKSTLSRNLERMQQRGWVESIPHPTDQRKIFWALSPAGQKLLEELYLPWQDAQQQIHDLLGKDGVKAIFDAAHKLN